jgi:ATP dependent DNA ligase domain
VIKSAFAPCLPTRSATVPAGPDWIHEIKHDGYRLIVQRDGKRVRLFTRNGHDWTHHYPLIVEAALRNRINSFVLDGEAVLLGADGVSDFDGLHSRRHNDAGSSMPSTCWRWTGRICGSCRCRCARPICRGFWRVALTAPTWRRLNRVRSGRTCSGTPV